MEQKQKPKVNLPWRDMHNAANVGVSRVIDSHEQRYRHRDHSSGILWDENIRGAQGEAAFARYREIEWNESVGAIGIADFPEINVDVKTRRRHNYELYIHQGDIDPKRKFVLVTTQGCEFIIHGWIFGEQRERVGSLKTFGQAAQRPAWYIPQNRLHDMDAFDMTYEQWKEQGNEVSFKDEISFADIDRVMAKATPIRADIDRAMECWT